jgi:hypothetical protein
MPFFKDIPDFKKYFKIAAAFDFEQLNVFLKDVDKTVLKKYLGAAFLGEIQAKYTTSITGGAALGGKDLILVELIRSCTPSFAIAKWIPTGQVSIDNTGIKINQTENSKAAYQYQVKDLQNSLLQTGTVALEDLLEYLDDNAVDFNTYKISAEYSSNRELFVNSSKEFVKHYSALGSSRVSFFLMRSIIKKVEDFEIKSVLLPDLFNSLKTKLKAGTVFNSNEQKLVDLIRPAIAHFTIAKSINELAAQISQDGYLVFDGSASSQTIDTKKTSPENTIGKMQHAALIDAKAYMDQLKTLLESNKDTYTLYRDDATYVAITSGVTPQNPKNSFYSGI